MTLFQIIDILKSIALEQPNIKTATDGSIYDVMNTNPSVKYDVVHFSQTTHQSDEETDYYGLNIFYVSRLEDSLENNRLQIQSIGKEILDNIIRTFCENWGIDFPIITYYPFTQKFNDLCAGCYCNLRLEIPKEIICADDYTAEVVPGSGIKLQDIGITITQNGLIVITPDAEYDGIGEIRIVTDVPQAAANLQYKEVEYTQNGEYTVLPDEDYDGMTEVAISVSVPATPDRYDEGYADGEAAQKAKLTTTTLTQNDTYTRTDGWSAITVNVPQTGQTINNQDKTVSINDLTYNNGHYTGQTEVSADSGYTGLGTVTVNTDIDAAAAITEGENIQKAKLSSTSFTQNDTYTNADGWSAITVNVPATPDRYDEGYADGVAAQKAKLSSTSFTHNGVYTRADGYSAVTVNVQDQDLIANLQGDYFVVPNGTTHIRDWAFYNTCFSSMTIPDSVSAIGNYSFTNNNCLKEITFGTGLTSIGENAFFACNNLEKMVFEGLVPPTINTGNSLGATNQTFPIFVPCQSLSAYQAAFGSEYAPRIQCINPPASDYHTLEFVYSTSTADETIVLFTGEAQTDSSWFNAFYKGILNIEIDGVVYGKNSGHISYNQPDVAYYWQNFESAGQHTVKYYITTSALTDVSAVYKYPGWRVPASLFTYSPLPNASVLKLVEANIGDGYVYLEGDVFQYNPYLTTLTIPSSVTGIGDSICDYCTGLTAVTVEATTPPTMEKIGSTYRQFDHTALQYIYVPAESVETYKATAGWARYANKITAITS